MTQDIPQSYATSLLAKLLESVGMQFEIDSRKYQMILRIGDILYNRGSRTRRLQYNDDTLKVNLNDTSRILYYATGSIFNHYKSSPLYRYMQTVLRNENNVFVDVGANLGVYSYLAKKLGAETAMFEPEPRLHSFLVANEPVLGKAYQIALSDTTSQQIFYIGSDKISGAHSLVGGPLGTPDSPYQSTTTVPTDTFDHFLENYPLPHITLIKIDVEGNETKTVRGMEQALASGIIDSVWCEVRGPQSGRNPNSYKDVTHIMKKYGYSSYTYSATGKKTAFVVNTAQDVLQVFDLLFTREK